jgi:hypothetical protein
MRCMTIGIELCLLLGLVGCAGTGDETDTAKTVASLRLGNGNEVHFYDFGTTALVTETGAAYTKPALDEPEIPAGELVNLWRKLAPEQPAPEALIALQNRLVQANIDNPASNARASRSDKPISETGGIPSISSRIEPALRTLEGCNNGCCDREWLQTLSTCSYTGWSSRWFLFNYGYSYANRGDIFNFRGLVCAATGTSSWSVHVGSYNKNFQVSEATYTTWSWTGGSSIWCGGMCGEDMTSTVNTSSARHLHTYCGMVQDD